MAIAVWSWSGSKTANVGERTVELSGLGISGNAVIRGIYYTVGLRASKYSSSRDWSLNYIRVADGPSMENVVRQSMSGTTDTICYLDTTDSNVYDVYRSTTLTVAINVACDHPTASTSIDSVIVEVEYDLPGVTIRDFSVSQRGSRYLFSWESDVVAVDNVYYTIHKFVDYEQSGQDPIDTISDRDSTSTSCKIPRTDYGNTVSFDITAVWEYSQETAYTVLRSNSITPEFMPMYVRYYRDGIAHDCSVSYYDGNNKEWLECEVNYYDGEKWVECSTI